MNVCFDVIANSGTEISATVTADGPDVDAASDTATLALAAPAVVEPVPTTGEWGLILLAAVLGLAGLFAMRRGGLAVLLIAACLVAAAPRPALAAPAKRVQVERQRPEGVQVKEVQSRGEQTTLVLADGRRFTVDSASLEIRDRRMTRDERRAARQEAKRDEVRAARKPRHAQNKLSAKDLAAIVSTPAASGAPQPATLGLALRNGKVESLRVTLYASQQQVEAAMARRDAADSRAAQRAPSAKK
jgi:hypothetical protein